MLDEAAKRWMIAKRITSPRMSGHRVQARNRRDPKRAAQASVTLSLGLSLRCGAGTACERKKLRPPRCVTHTQLKRASVASGQARDPTCCVKEAGIPHFQSIFEPFSR